IIRGTGGSDLSWRRRPWCAARCCREDLRLLLGQDRRRGSCPRALPRNPAPARRRALARASVHPLLPHPMIRVLVIDDHAILRTGIRSMLEREGDFTVVGQAANADQAVSRARALPPDVILLDVVMPRKSGFETLPELRAVAPEARVIMLSMQTNPSSLRKSLNARAARFVAKHASEADLFDAIRRVAAGSRYVDPELAGDLIVPDS